MKIPINQFVFYILIEKWWNVEIIEDNYYDEYFEPFEYLFSDKEDLTLEDKFKIVKDIIDNNIEIVDEVNESYDLGHEYKESVLVLKYKDRFYGLSYWYGTYADLECKETVDDITELPEYEPVMVLSYKIK